MTFQSSIQLDTTQRHPLLKSKAHSSTSALATATKRHPRGLDAGASDARVFFIGTATTILEWRGFRLLTDPNFLHAGDHVHLGPGVQGTRRTDPALELTDLPPLDAVLLSHYHEDHFDQVVEGALDRGFRIITTPHAKGCLEAKAEPFRNVVGLDFWDSVELENQTELNADRKPVIKVTGMPGKHVPPGPLAVANDVLGAVPPTNGWLLELGYRSASSTSRQTNYRIYISGDTLLVDELKEIPQWLQNDKIDLMLVHLGGTTIPGPKMPLLMVTMDARQGVELMRLMDPDVTVPIHFDDYDVFMSPLADFKTAVREAGLEQRVVYLDRGEEYQFTVGNWE